MLVPPCRLDGKATGSASASPAITGCVLARNEERRLPDALASLQGWTAQILVIDDSSTDRTTEIAVEHGAEVITAPPFDGPRPCFDALRNLVIERAIGEWI